MYISELSNHEEAARTLIEAGADLNCSYEDTAETLAMFAAAYASPKFVKFLVSQPNLFLDAQVAEAGRCGNNVYICIVGMSAMLDC